MISAANPVLGLFTELFIQEMFIVLCTFLLNLLLLKSHLKVLGSGPASQKVIPRNGPQKVIFKYFIHLKITSIC